jgi:hypothetical protein
MRTGHENGPLPPPPPPLRQSSPYQLELREGSTWLMALVGLPFFLAGVSMAVGVLPFEAEPYRKWGSAVLGLASLAFIVVGSLLMFARKRLTLDLMTGSVTRWRGLLIPMQREERRLNEFTAVVIAFDRGDSETPDRYPVRLRAVSGKDFLIAKHGKFSESRKQAEYLCRALRLPLADMTTDHETVVTPELASVSLRERILAGDVHLDPAAAPAGMRSAVSESGGVLTIVIPRYETALFHVLFALVILLLIVIPTLLQVFSRKASPSGGQVTLLIVFGLLVAIPLLSGAAKKFVGRKRKGTTVQASPAGLSIENRTAWRTQAKIVSAAEILDLDYATFEGALKSARRSSNIQVPPSATTAGMFAGLRSLVPNQGIVVKSRQELITFGEGLTAEELQYLSWVLKKALASR